MALLPVIFHCLPFVECLLNYNFEITYIALKSLTGRYKAILSLEKKILIGIEHFPPRLIHNENVGVINAQIFLCHFSHSKKCFT